MCWHRWSKWQTTEQADITHEGRKIGWTLLQKRECAKCGKVEIDCQKAWGV